MAHKRNFYNGVRVNEAILFSADRNGIINNVRRAKDNSLLDVVDVKGVRFTRNKKYKTYNSPNNYLLSKWFF